MRPEAWLARPWPLVHAELERLEQRFDVSYTEAPKRRAVDGVARVVRIRKDGERFMIVLAREVVHDPETTP